MDEISREGGGSVLSIGTSVAGVEYRAWLYKPPAPFQAET